MSQFASSINRANARELAHLASRLSQSFSTSRQLRRCLQQAVSLDGILSQVFSQASDGHNDEQLAALVEYAKGLVKAQRQYLPEGPFVYEGTICDEQLGIVANTYGLAIDPQQASLRELRSAVQALTVLAECMAAFAANPNASALVDCPDYVYRGLPCSIRDDSELWAVQGQDARGGGGVLEWCYDEHDAREVLASMQRYPKRFLSLSATSWAATVTSQATACA